MTSLLAFALIAPAQSKPKDPPKPADAPTFGIPVNSEYYWPVHLLTSPDVQKELKLSKEQVKLAEGMRPELKKAGEAMGTLTPAQAKKYTAEMTTWAEKSLADLLSPEQRTRHRQILWQVLEFNGGVRGMAANPVFAKDVGLTADQQARAKKIEADYQAAWMKLVRANPGGNAAIPGEEALAKKYEEAALKLLTDEQKKKWNELLGEPFKGDIVQFPIPGLRPVTFKAPEKK